MLLFRTARARRWSSARRHADQLVQDVQIALIEKMKIGLFTEFSYPDKSEQQTYAEVLEQIALADEQGYDFFSTTESYGRDLFSCSPFPLGLYVAAAQRTKRIRFLTGIVSAPAHHPAVLASEVAAADLLTGGRIMLGIGRGHPWVLNRLGL